MAAAMLAAASWAAAAEPASPDNAGQAQGSCFIRRDWTGLWTMAPDARTMYIDVAHRTYRLDLDAPYTLLKSPWALLSNRDSSDVICSAVDFRLVVSDRIGTKQNVIVRHLTLLTAAEAAALPKDLRPPS